MNMVNCLALLKATRLYPLSLIYLVVESGSLRAVNSFNSYEEDIYELGILTTYFVDNLSLISMVSL